MAINSNAWLLVQRLYSPTTLGMTDTASLQNWYDFLLVWNYESETYLQYCPYSSLKRAANSLQNRRLCRTESGPSVTASLSTVILKSRFASNRSALLPIWFIKACTLIGYRNILKMKDFQFAQNTLKHDIPFSIARSGQNVTLVW